MRVMTQSDNTITANPKTLTPAQLREALDAWCVAQPGVIKCHQIEGGFFVYKILVDDDLGTNWFQITYLLNTGVGYKDFLSNAETFLALTAFAIEHRHLIALHRGTSGAGGVGGIAGAYRTGSRGPARSS